ncbi:hypothetical protein [Moorena producens]
MNRCSFLLRYTPVDNYIPQKIRGSRESGAVRPVANLIRLRKAHRGNRE